MSPLLVAEGLSIGSRLAPTRLSLEEGCLCCLIGPNGSGKTSLLHAIAGIGAPEGKVRIDGSDPRGLQPQRRQRLFTYLPATREIKWPIKAADLIALGAATTEDISEMMIEALELTPLLDRQMDQLSTGERSRVLIARALATRPRLLLLDEPIANLDPCWQLRLCEYLRELTRSCGCSALMAVHDLEIARRYGDRLIIMNEGRIAADGAPQPLLESQKARQIFGVERREEGWQLIR
jgi:iron complex transport system ATP-binding protein